MTDNSGKGSFEFEVKFPNGGAGTAFGALAILLSHEAPWGVDSTESKRLSFKDMFPRVRPGMKDDTGDMDHQNLARQLFCFLNEASTKGINELANNGNKYNGLELDLWFHSNLDDTMTFKAKESGDIETTACIVQHLIGEFNLDPVYFEYAIGGPTPDSGGMYCSSDGIEHMSRDDWLSRQQQEGEKTPSSDSGSLGISLAIKP